MSLLCAFRASGKCMTRGGLLKPAGSLSLFQAPLSSYIAIGHQRLCIKATTSTLLNNAAGYSRLTIRLEFTRTFHSSRTARQKDQSSENADSNEDTKIDDRIKYLLYDMPLRKQIRYLRIFFVFNFVCSIGLSIWARQDGIYTTLAAWGIGVAGFIPMAVVQIFYRAHIRNIHMLGKFSKKQLRIMRNPAKYGNSEVEYPVLSDTPLAIQKFSFTARDPKFNILARDIQPGPTRRFSVSWFYNSPDGKVEKFRISKRILQHHPDLRALDTLVRNNAQQTQTTKPKKNKNKTKKQENASAQIFNV